MRAYVAKKYRKIKFKQLLEYIHSMPTQFIKEINQRLKNNR